MDAQVKTAAEGPVQVGAPWGRLGWTDLPGGLTPPRAAQERQRAPHTDAAAPERTAIWIDR